MDECEVRLDGCLMVVVVEAGRFEVRFVVERREKKKIKETCWLYTQKTMVDDRKPIVKVKVDVAIAMFSRVVPRFVTPFCGLKPYTVRSSKTMTRIINWQQCMRATRNRRT